MEMPETWSCCFFPGEKSTFRKLLNYPNSRVLFTAQCKRPEFLVEIQPGFQEQQFHLRSCQSFGQSWRNHSLEMAFCSKRQCVEFLSSTVSTCTTLFPSPVLSQQLSWERAESSSVCGGFFAFGTLKWEEVLRKGRAGGCQPHLLPSCCLSAQHREMRIQGNADTGNSSAKPPKKQPEIKAII